MSDIDRPIGIAVQRCPSCESSAVQRFSIVDGKVWLVCGRCDLRWSIAERRSAAVADYRGFERRLRV
jgi:ribosomal protein L37AE/L43A